MGRDVPGDTYPGTDRTIDAGSRLQFGLRQARNDRTGVTKNFPPPGGATPELRTHDMTTNTGSTKTTARKAKLRANTVKLRKDGKPDARSTRLKTIHAEAKALRDEANAQKPAKPKLGRPTKYRPEMCERVLELGQLGKTREQIAADLKIGWKTLHRWEGLHPAFRHALKEARARSLAYWQGIAQEIASGERKANALALIFALKNQFPDHFRDRTENTVSVKHQFSPGFEDFLEDIAQQKRADQAKVIDAKILEND